MHRGNLKAVADLFKGDIRLGFHLFGSELGFAEDQRQRHGEASGVRGADQFFRIGARLALETAGEAVGIGLQAPLLVKSRPCRP